MEAALKVIALLAFLLWEAWWAHEFITAPRPDEEMRTVAALVFGVAIPIFLGIVIGLAARVRWFHRVD